MTNPYTVLGVNQNADKKQIIKAQIIAMKNKDYSLQEIAIATKQLLDPAKRLAADFMLPSKMKVKKIKLIHINIFDQKISIAELDENAFDSLKM